MLTEFEKKKKQMSEMCKYLEISTMFLNKLSQSLSRNQKYFKLNENKNTEYKIIGYTVKPKTKGEFIAMTICIIKEEKSQIRMLSFYL